VVTVGKTKEQAARTWADQYAARVRGGWRLVFDAVPSSRRPEPPARRREETAALLNRVPAGSEAVALDLGGKAMDTGAFAAFLGSRKDAGRPLCFLVGGAHGLDREALGRTARLSLSPMTLAHELALVVLCEQIYRAHSLCTGGPYAK